MLLMLFCQSARDLEFQRQTSESTRSMFESLWAFWITRGHIWWVVAGFVLIFGWAMIQGTLARHRDREKNYKQPFHQKLED